MSRRTLFVAVALTLAGCEQAPLRKVELALERKPADATSQRQQLLARFDARLQRELPAPAQSYQRCPDESLAPSELLLRIRDARSERRNIMPLDLLQTLAPDPLAALRDVAAAPPAVLSELEPLTQRRYLGELVIEAFSAPFNFRRLNAIHSEWSAGKLDAKLVIYDLEAGSVLCVAPVHARGDATGASLARRLRESTRTELTRRLYARSLREIESALGSVSRVLRLPQSQALLLSQNDG